MRIEVPVSWASDLQEIKVAAACPGTIADIEIAYTGVQWALVAIGNATTAQRTNRTLLSGNEGYAERYCLETGVHYLQLDAASGIGVGQWSVRSADGDILGSGLDIGLSSTTVIVVGPGLADVVPVLSGQGLECEAYWVYGGSVQSGCQVHLATDERVTFLCAPLFHSSERHYLVRRVCIY